MKKLIILLIVAIGSFLTWKYFNEKPQPQPTPISPEQEVNALLARSVIPSTELSALSKKYPDIVARVFKGKKIQVTGVLTKALTLGVNSDNLALELEGSAGLKIKFHSDYQKLLKWVVNLREIQGFKFHRESQTIIFVGYLYSITKDGKKLNRQSFAEPICTEGDHIILRGEFRHIGSGWVKCDLLEVPNFPQRLTTK